MEYRVRSYMGQENRILYYVEKYVERRLLWNYWKSQTYYYYGGKGLRTFPCSVSAERYIENIARIIEFNKKEQT